MSMSKELMIEGGKKCSGSIQIAGSKNASLPEMAACLLTDKTVTLKNAPQIDDIELMKNQLRSYGVEVNDNGSTLVVRATQNYTSNSPTSDVGSKTRGSFLVLGALLARFGVAKVYFPGGCQIVQGGRPVNYHINALAEMGATIEQNGEYIVLRAGHPLHGAHIEFPQISVGATENIVMAACLAEGQTVITKAAVEPEVVDLVNMLEKMGAKIDVYSNENKIVINGSGGALLGGCTHTVIPDRIEAGTWAIAAAMTGGELLLKMDPTIGQQIMVPIIEKLKSARVSAEWQQNGLKVQRFGPIEPVNVITAAFPGFPTDLLPQWTTFMTLANGESDVKDTIYNNRFKHVEYLKKMGAKITPAPFPVDSQYRVHGRASLSGTHVVATDLRAGAALILAGLVATGYTVVKEFQHVLRGYENIEEKLKCWGPKSFQKLPPTRKGHHGGHCQVYNRR